jgi:hypothetical protein
MTCTVTIIQYVYYKSWFWFFAVLASLSQSCLNLHCYQALRLTDFTTVEAVGYIFKAVSAANQDNRCILGSQDQFI